jgi:hypothetical protein
MQRWGAKVAKRGTRLEWGCKVDLRGAVTRGQVAGALTGVCSAVVAAPGSRIDGSRRPSGLGRVILVRIARCRYNFECTFAVVARCVNGVLFVLSVLEDLAEVNVKVWPWLRCVTERKVTGDWRHSTARATGARRQSWVATSTVVYRQDSNAMTERMQRVRCLMTSIAAGNDNTSST